jgi:hypothetical protein
MTPDLLCEYIFKVGGTILVLGFLAMFILGNLLE